MTTPQVYDDAYFEQLRQRYEDELKKRRVPGLLPQAAAPTLDAAVGDTAPVPTAASSLPDFDELKRQYEARPITGQGNIPLDTGIPEPAPSLPAAPERKPDRWRGIGAFTKKAAGRAYEQTGLKGTVAAADWFQRNVSEPIGATANVVQLPGPEIPYISRGGGFDFNPEQLPGMPDWRERYRENVPIGGRIATEAVLDPLNLAPGIGFTKMAQLRRLGGRLGRRPVKAGEIFHDILLRDETGKVWSMQMPDTAEATAFVDDLETRGSAIRLSPGHTAQERQAGVQRLRAARQGVEQAPVPVEPAREVRPEAEALAPFESGSTEETERFLAAREAERAALSPVEQAELRLEEARTLLEAEQVRGLPVPKFGTRERQEYDAARMRRRQAGERVTTKRERVAEARQRVAQAQDEVARLGAEAQTPVAPVVPEVAVPILKEGGAPASAKIGDDVRFRRYGREIEGSITQATQELAPEPAWRILLHSGQIEYVPKADILSVTKAFQPTEQVGAIQSGMGIGEAPSQGTLGLAGQEGISRPLIDAQQVAERQRLAAEQAAGQAALPEQVAVERVSRVHLFTRGGSGMPFKRTVTLLGGKYRIQSTRGSPGAGIGGGGPVWQIVDDTSDPFQRNPRLFDELIASGNRNMGILVPVETRAKVLKSGFATKREAEAFAGKLLEGERFVAEQAAGQAGLPQGAGVVSPDVPPAAVAPPSGVPLDVPSPAPNPAAATPPPGQPPTPPTSLLNPRVPPEKDPVIQKALKVLRGVKRVSQREQAAMFAAERKARFARGMGASGGLPIREGFPRFFGAQASEFPRPDIEPIVGQFTEDEVNHLFRRIEAPGILRSGFDQNNAAKALAELLHPSTAKIPMPRDLALLERAFGAKFVRALYNKKRTASQAVWDEFIAAWNLPRSVKASLDLSASLRQGAMLAPGNLPQWKTAIGAELKAYRSERYAAQAWDDIYLHANFERLTSAGLSLTERGAIAPLLAREEAFMSRWAGRIPGIRASERAYVTMLNKLRFDVANKMLEGLERQGLSGAELERQLSGAMDYINWTTGRGPAIGTGALGTGIQAILNGTMFSPRFMTSRFATLLLPVTAYRNPAIRRKLATDLVAWVSTVSMVVGLAKVAGADVEIDPRSGQWGAVKIGNTRYDPWAGMKPVARLIAQLMLGQSKSSLGKVYSTDDEDLISKRQRLKAEGRGTISDEEFARSGRFAPARLNRLKSFLRSKLQPLAGEAVSQSTGEDWIGGEARPGQFLSKDIRVNRFFQVLAPILAEDILDAVAANENPLAIGVAAAVSAVGVGASTYQTVGDIAKEEFPAASLEELRAKPKWTQERWREEANRRRGIGTAKKPELRPSGMFGP